MAEETSTGSIGTARIDVTVNTETMQSGIEGAKRKVSGLGTEAEAQFNKASASSKRYAESLLRQADLLGKTRAEQIAYNAQTRIGGDLGEKIAAKALANQTKISSAFGATAKSAGELQFAMRSLPAQITDIFVGLSTGQRPLSVLLQQGGQLKDLFGGIGPAAKALGSSLLGLINPFTVTAAAAAALFLAWKQGSDEATSYGKAIITTGNYAGITSDQLSGLSSTISKNVGTQHEAAAALSEVASSGKFTAEQLGLVSRAALDQSRLTGQATATTIAEFAKLRDDPVKAVLELNDAQHFLTESTYARIKALADEGKQQDAATLAIQTYSRSLDERRAEVVKNTGLIEQAWGGVASAAKAAWDAMLDVGRKETGQQKFDSLFQQLDKLQNSSFAFADLGPIGSESRQKRIAQIRAQLAQLQDDAKKAAVDASKQRIDAELVQDRADSDREVQQYASNAQKRAAAIIKTQQEYNDRIQRALAAGNKELADKLRADEKLVLAGINDKLKDPKVPKKAVSPEVAAYAALKGQVDALQVKNITADNAALTQYEQGIRKLADEMGVYLSKSGDAAKAAAEFNRGQKALAQTLERAKQQEINAERAYAAALEKSNQALADQVNAQIARIGSGQKEYDRTQQLTRAYQEQATALQDLALKRQMGIDGQSGGLSKDQYDADVNALRAATDEKVRIIQDGFTRQDAAQASWLNGAKAAYQDYVDQTADVANATYNVFSSALDGLTDAFAEFFTKGKADWRSFATDILKQIEKILIAKAIAGIAGSVSGSFGFQGGTSSSTFAKGGVFADSPGLSAYSGSVVSKPTMFAFARGAGVMGEAGPEAILPLRRGPDGRLGVAASGSAEGGGDISLSQTFVIDSSGTNEQTRGSNDDAVRQFASKMKSVAQQTILDEQRPGGSLWRMRQQA